MGIIKKFNDFERGRTLPSPLDLNNPEHRKKAEYHFRWADHAVLRTYWTNFAEIAPGAYRSNQPDPARWEEYAQMGIKSVINLRGVSEKAPHFLFEEECTNRLGMTRYDLSFGARAAPKVQTLLSLLEIFHKIEKPFLLHCKSGADRAGLASAIYQHAIAGRPIEEAQKMLSFRFLHLKFTKTGILDLFLAQYAERHIETGIGFEDWVRTEYDPKALQDAFSKRRIIPL
ncbi:tyrosine-protein phosphatase [Phaeobacter sp. CNT1-3]|jgi:protein tyrosine/serine phosphatase|nr:tyrosine-protein phosphatase [Phaeobacter sp. CNT1-3]